MSKDIFKPATDEDIKDRQKQADRLGIKLMPLIPRGAIQLYEGSVCPDGWRFAPEYEVGRFWAMPYYPNYTWDQIHQMNPNIHYIEKL